MKDPTVIHKLARPGAKSVRVRFIHSDEKEHTFYSVVNDLTGDRLSGFDNAAPSIDDSLAWVRSVVRDLKLKATVLEIVGDIQ